MIYAILYVLFTAVANLLVHIFGNSIPEMLMMFLSVSYAIMFFHSINAANITKMYSHLVTMKREYLLLMLTIVGLWTGAFLIPIHFLPSIYLFTYMAGVGLLGSFSLLFNNKSQKYFLYIAVISSANIVLFYIFSARFYHGAQYLLMFFSTILTACFGYLYLRLSVKFNLCGFSASQVLAVRFWLFWLVLLAINLHENLFSKISVSILLESLIISATTLVIPLFCSQKSVENIGANRTSIFYGFTPIATFILEKIFLKDTLNYTIYFSVILAIIVSFAAWKTMLQQSKR